MGAMKFQLLQTATASDSVWLASCPSQSQWVGCVHRSISEVKNDCLQCACVALADCSKCFHDPLLTLELAVLPRIFILNNPLMPFLLHEDRFAHCCSVVVSPYLRLTLQPVPSFKPTFHPMSILVIQFPQRKHRVVRETLRFPQEQGRF